MIEIKHKFTGATILAVDADTLAGAQLAGASLEVADLAHAKLGGAVLNGANLAAADLTGADLGGADLAAAILSGANLEGAALVNASLADANLAGANLAGADLTGANLSGARLVGANLAGADLANADLRGADISRGSLEDASLQGALYNETTRYPELFFDPHGKGAVLVQTPAVSAIPLCVRFYLFSPCQVVADLFDLASPIELAPRYNIAPSQPVAVGRLGEHGRELVSPRWGLIPSWAKDAKFAPINARAETAADKPTSRHAMRKRRCLIPSNGFTNG